MAKNAEATSEGTEPSLADQIKRQQNQIDALMALLAAKTGPRKIEANLAPVPEPSEELRPGTYVQRGVDAFGAPVMGKVRWTKDWIEKTYAPVTFTPNRSMIVAPHNISYTLSADVETTVPCIVKDLYDGVIRQEREQAAKYRPLTATEQADVDARANAEPGTKQWSRVTRVGFGLNIPDVPDSTPEAAPIA